MVVDGRAHGALYRRAGTAHVVFVAHSGAVILRHPSRLIALCATLAAASCGSSTAPTDAPADAADGWTTDADAPDATAPDATADATDAPSADDAADALDASDAGPIAVRVNVTITDPCTITFAPAALDVPPGRTMQLTIANTSITIQADVWPSSGGADLGLAPGAAWVVPDDFCQVPGTQYVDVFRHNQSGCRAQRLAITCP
jgi:hypothetical protein